MEGRLYELIRDFQADRAESLGAKILEFRADALRRFALARPDRYPEYLFDDGRLDRAIAHARAAGEILPPIAGARDELLYLCIDQDRAS
jgi:hypothetical protein